MIPPIFDSEWKIKNQTRRDSDDFHVKDIDGPIGEQVEQAGRIRFVIDHQIIAADGGVDKINDDDVNVRPDGYFEDRFPRGAEAFDGGHVNS